MAPRWQTVADAVAGFHIADRVLGRAHALEEVPHVVVANGQAQGVVRQGFGEHFALGGLDGFAVHPDPAVTPFSPSQTGSPVYSPP
jgi:hypothetical protein